MPLDLLDAIKAECKGGEKVHLTKLRNYLLGTPSFSKLIDINHLSTLSSVQARKYMLRQVCPLMKKEATHPNKPQLVDNPKRDVTTVNAVKVKLSVNSIDDKYMSHLSKEIEETESAFGLSAFEKEIASDAFVRMAVEAEETVLLIKLDRYSKLAKLNFDEGTVKEQNPMSGQKPIKVGAAVEFMRDTAALKIRETRQVPLNEKIRKKRMQLRSILSDPDNGITTIKGKSRESVRSMLIKVVYMFLRSPQFFTNSFINFMVTGPAGSGKTKVASVIAHTFKELGLLMTDKVMLATRQNLVAEYLGQTAVKTRNLLINSIEGVLFIDEAYALTPCADEKSNAYSEEAVSELINFMDKFNGCYVTIVAGYKRKMYDCFLKFNEGLQRRFPRVLDFIPYSSSDLYLLFEKFLQESIDNRYSLSMDQKRLIKGIIKALNANDVFNNQAGDMLNLSKVIAEDLILLGDAYDTEKIQLSFKRFVAPKEKAIFFS